MIYKIFEFINSETNIKSFISISAKPHGGLFLEQEIINYKNIGVEQVTSFLTQYEIENSNLQEEKKLCEKHGLEYLNYPIPDFNSPENINDYKNLVSDILNLLKVGKSVLVHCYAGLGRSGTFVACLLKPYFNSTESLLDFISEKRNAKIPETTDQVEFVKNF